MINQLANLNWISVLLAFVVYFLIGALWFTLFFRKWYKISLGKEHQALGNRPLFIVGPAVCSLVITLAHAILLYSLNISSFGKAMEFAWLTGIGYLVANTINIAINPNIPRPILYGIISGGYHLTGISIVSLILVAMK